jgi:pimeloyl-ACP methyl ester carboxylesterase
MTRPILVGWSLGGVILSHYLAAFGSRGLGGIVLAGAVTSFKPDYFEPETGEVLDLLCSKELVSRLRGIRRFVDDCFAAPMAPALRDRTIAYNAMVPGEVHEATRALTLDGTEGVWAGLQAPCLVVHGAKDRLVRVAMSKHSAWEIPRSELKVYEEASHGPMVDTAADFNADLLSFLAKTSGSQPTRKN